ncbi:MAG: AI-2E family transporter [Gemmatimonadota bacterium]
MTPMLGIFLLLAIAALKLGGSLLLPIVVAGMLALLLAPTVRWLAQHRLPTGLAAGLVMIGVTSALVIAVTLLANPAADWLERAPKSLAQAERKIRRLSKPLQTLQQTAEKVQQVTQSAGVGGGPPNGAQSVTVAPAGLMSKLSGTTISAVGALLTVIFLAYFLLAMGDRFRDKFADMLPERHRREMAAAIVLMQRQMSHYLLLTTLIAAAVGVLTWGALEFIGFPNPALWGVVAGVLNFIPYVGAVVTLVVLGLTGLVSFDTTREPLLAMGAFLVINMIESNLATPMLLGRRLPLNPVAIFVGLLFWSWIWGITGAVLAVPLTVMVKVIADRVESLKAFGELLDN